MATSKRKRYSSDRRERYQELRAEGRIGPEFGKLGGRPKKSPTDSQSERAGAAVAAAARENSHVIAQVFLDVLNDNSKSDGQKIKALKIMLNVEQSEEQLRRDDEARGRQPEPPDFSDPEAAREYLERALQSPLVRERMAALLAASSPE